MSANKLCHDFLTRGVESALTEKKPDLFYGIVAIFSCLSHDVGIYVNSGVYLMSNTGKVTVQNLVCKCDRGL